MSEALAAGLREMGIRVRVDARTEHRPGFKFNEWELKGVPLRLEVGARDLAREQATLVRRDSGEKEQVPLQAVASRSAELLGEIQKRLLSEAVALRAARTLDGAASYEELREFLAGGGGFARAPWCGSAACEERVKADTRATFRCLGLEPDESAGRCVVCRAEATERATWAQAY